MTEKKAWNEKGNRLGMTKRKAWNDNGRVWNDKIKKLGKTCGGQ